MHLIRFMTLAEYEHHIHVGTSDGKTLEIPDRLPDNDPRAHEKRIHDSVYDLVMSRQLPIKGVYAHFRGQQLLKQIHHSRNAPTIRSVTPVWITGPSGIGKTARITSEFPDAYIKYSYDHFFDGYDGQDVIVFHEMPKYLLDPKDSKNLIQDFKNWTDPNNTTKLLPVKGSSVPAKHTIFIFTSNVSLEEMLYQMTYDDASALRRRIIPMNITSVADSYAIYHPVTRRTILLPSLVSIQAS